MIGLGSDKNTYPNKMRLPHHCPPSTLCSGHMERSGSKGSHLGPALVDRPTQLFYIWIFICYLCKYTNLKDTAGQSASPALVLRSHLGPVMAMPGRGKRSKRAKTTPDHPLWPMRT